MSVDVDELVRKITAEVTKQVLATIVLESKDSEEWPEWDEFNQIEEDVKPVEVKPSPLRSRLSGIAEEVVEDDEEEISQGVSTGNVTPITGFSESHRGGFDPRSNPSWFEAQYRREVLLPSRAAPK